MCIKVAPITSKKVNYLFHRHKFCFLHLKYTLSRYTVIFLYTVAYYLDELGLELRKGALLSETKNNFHGNRK